MKFNLKELGKYLLPILMGITTGAVTIANGIDGKKKDARNAQLEEQIRELNSKLGEK